MYSLENVLAAMNDRDSSLNPETFASPVHYGDDEFEIDRSIVPRKTRLFFGQRQRNVLDDSQR
jgi:hypothetical protein